MSSGVRIEKELSGRERKPSPVSRSGKHSHDTQTQGSLQPNSHGEPLDERTRRHFESRFGHDFSHVRVHAGSAAGRSARTVGALAYTYGNDIVFGSGSYQPGTQAGRQLLAHELAHVVQQRGVASAHAGTVACESEAAHVGRRVAAGELARVSLSAPAGIQRQAIPELNPDLKLAESASPMMAAVIGSVSLDGFATGKSDISGGNESRLAHTAETIQALLRRYPASAIHVIGHTDAVGREGDNVALGQMRADSVQAELIQMGIPPGSIHTESRGASQLLVRTARGEARNRRVDVNFEPSRLLEGGLSKGLTLGPTEPPPNRSSLGTEKEPVPGVKDLCFRHPDICYGKGQGSPDRPPSIPPAALQPIPDDTPFDLMDVQGINANYTSHGGRPEGDELRRTWAQIYWKYRLQWGLPKPRAAAAANAELSGTAGKSQSRENPNSVDRLNDEMRQGYPNSTTIGPKDFTIWRF